MAKTPTSAGGAFQRQFQKSADRHGMCHRIPDSTFIIKKRVGFEMGSRKSISDFFWFITDNQFTVCLVEAKATAEKRIEFERLQPHQEDALVDFEALSPHTKGYIAVNVYDSKNIRQTNRLFMVPVLVWVELRDTLDRKSIPLATLDEHEEIIECPRCKGSMWDMEPFVQALTAKKEKTSG